MISNQVLQNTLEGLKEISRTEFCVLDTEGKVLASTFADFSIATQDVQAFVESQADSQLVKGFQYFIGFIIYNADIYSADYNQKK